MSDQLAAEISNCTTHNTHNRETSMPLVGFEPTISAVERPHTYELARPQGPAGRLVQYNG